jgi:predicted nucleic acid-binding protein
MQKRPSIVAAVAHAGGVSNLSVAAITVAELRYGVEALPAGRRKRSSMASLDAVLSGLEVRTFTEDTAAVYGRAGALLEASGVAFSFPDLAIASVALVDDMTVASNDSFFEHAGRVCGLGFERWIP